MLIISHMGDVAISFNDERNVARLEVNVIAEVLPLKSCMAENGCQDSLSHESTEAARARAQKGGYRHTYNSDVLSNRVEESPDVLDTVHYYHRNELSKAPVALTYPLIKIPHLDDVRIVGAAKIHVLISEEGQVEKIVASEVSLPEDYMKEIIDSYRKIKFLPGELLGKKVKSKLEFEVSFLADEKIYLGK